MKIMSIVSGKRVQAFLSERKGVTAIEYGILAAGVAVVIGGLVANDGQLTQALNRFFQNVLNAVPQGGEGAAGP